MINIMVDIETLGTRPNASVVAIGACRFDTEVDKKNTFYRSIHLGSAMKERSVDYLTLKWWLEQKDEARLELTKGTAGLGSSIADFVDWLPGGRFKIWGNGAGFDVTILEDVLRQYGHRIPWDFWMIRDVRTVVDLSSLKVDKSKLAGVAHNALDDALFQAEYVTEMIKEIKK